MSISPLVSVVMPVFNSEKYVRLAIESILNQTFSDFEFIIVDDCSTDASVDIIKEFSDSRIKLIQNPTNLKTTATLNKGLQQSTGKYILRMDSDDWSFPDRLEKQVIFMETNNDVVECGGSIIICDKNLNQLNVRDYPVTDSLIRSKIFYYNPFAHPATIWRKEAVIQAGCYDESIPLTQDYDLTFRVGKIGLLANLPDVILKLRTHEKSSSQAKSRQQELITLQIRKRAVSKYGYTMNIMDKLYYYLQLLSMYLIPQKLKFSIFNVIRKFY